MRSSVRLALALCAPLVPCLPAAAQTLTGIVPEAAEPGDLVVLRGSGLASTTHVLFTGQVGGFVGTWEIGVVPLSATPTEVRAIVPLFNSFVGPSATPPSHPVGTVTVLGGAAVPAQLDFYFMEEKHGQVTTPGHGTTLSSGEVSVCHFALAGGEPVSNNPTFTPKLGLAVPGTIPVLAVGHQATPPFVIIGGNGDLVIDFAAPIFGLLVGSAVGPDGSSSVALPIPKICAAPSGFDQDPVCGVPVALQWGMIDPGTLGLAVSGGMFVTL